MTFPQIRFLFAACCCLATAALANTAIVNFEKPTYTTGNLIGQGLGTGWAPSGAPAIVTPDNACVIIADTNGNQAPECKTENYSTLHYHFESDVGGGVTTPPLLQVSWRWRPLQSSVRECLSVAGSGIGDSTTGRAMSKVGVCFFENGSIQVQGQGPAISAPSSVKWTLNAWNYVRLLVDEPAQTWTVYLSADSLGVGEQLVGQGALNLANPLGATIGRATRVVLRAEVGSGDILLDDLGWERSTYWKAAAAGSWSTAANWYGGTAPDAHTHVVFNDKSAAACTLTSSATVKSITVTGAYTGTLNIDSCNLTVVGSANFSGGNYDNSNERPGTGIRFSSAFSQSLTGPSASGPAILPPIIHDGTGRLRLDGQALKALSLVDSAGTFDFNGFDLALQGSLRVTQGGPSTFAGLGGRKITVGASSLLDGSPGSLLGLNPGSAWQIVHKASDTLGSHYAVIANSTASPVSSFAYNWQNGGGNQGWIFAAAPVLLHDPANLSLVSGQAAVFKVAVARNLDPTFHWYRNGTLVYQGPDSVYTAPKVHLKDDQSKFHCLVTNAVGSDTSLDAVLTVTLPAPTANPDSGTFADSLPVKIIPPAAGVPIRYSLDGGAWKDYPGSLTLKASATLSAVAVVDSDIGVTGSWSYTKSSAPPHSDTLPPPGFLPAAGTFNDTVTVTLTSSSGSEIHFTVDGTEPDSNSPKFPDRRIFLDTSAIIKAAAYKPGFVRSPAASRTYLLKSTAPVASPGAGHRTSAISVSLTASTSKAEIRYTVDKSTPTATHGAKYTTPFALDSNTTLMAVAVTGHGDFLQTSPMLTADYTFDIPSPATLAPGGSMTVGSKYVLTNNSSASSADVVTLTQDDVKLVTGFQSIVAGIRVAPHGAGAALPPLGFTAPAGEAQSFYRRMPDGTVRFLTHADSLSITEAGAYFRGVDASPPEITLLGETIGAGDSTHAEIAVKDNVSNILLTLFRSDDARRGFNDREIETPDTLMVVLKNPDDILRSLDLKLRADDRHQKAFFPADTSAGYSLRQKTGPVHGPAVFKIGGNAQEPWDLVSIPLAVNPLFTLADLRKNNSADSLRASVWVDALNGFHSLDPSDPLEPGKSFWLGQWNSLASFAFPGVQTVPRGRSGAYSLIIKPGWNQIADPCLQKLYWPVSWKLPSAAYDASLLRGLHAHDPAEGFSHSDSLLPWKGYYVLYKGTRDTVVTLLSAPSAATLAKVSAARGAAPSDRFELVLGLGSGEPLRLGASPQGHDGIGIEDDPQPASPGGGGARLASLRESARLGVDMLRWAPRAVFRWEIAVGLPPAQGNTQDTHGADEGARVRALDLPPGFAVWAVSEKRGLRFPLDAGGSLPLAAGFTDSMEVYAGPADLLEARLRPIPLAAGAFRCEVSALPGGFALHLRLPEASEIRWSLWTPGGRLVDRGALVLPTGIYDLARPGRTDRLQAGMYILRVLRQGSGSSEQSIRKMVLPR